MPLSQRAARTIARRLAHMRATRDTLVIDGDVHPSDRSILPAETVDRLADPNYFHGRPLLSEALFETMDRAGVDMALCWQNPAVLPYTEDADLNFQRLKTANERIAALGAAHPDRVIPAGWTDPKALGLDHAIELAELCIADLGMPVVKMNPAQNAYPIDAPMVLAVADRIVGLGAVPAFHFGSDTAFTPPEGLERVAARYPDHPVIAVHMGGGGGHFVEAEPIYQGARALGLRRPNIFYVLSAIRDTHAISALITYAAAGVPYAHNLAAGSDAPYADMLWYFAGLRSVLDGLRQRKAPADPRLVERPDLFDDGQVADFMGGNLADLIIATDSRLLDAAGDGGT